MPKESTQFKKGQTGNAGGRPTDPLKDLAKSAAPAALQFLIDLSEGKGVYKKAPLKVRTTASIYVIERGYGKPIQEVKGDFNVFTKAWTGAIERSAEVGSDGHVHIRAQEKISA